LLCPQELLQAVDERPLLVCRLSGHLLTILAQDPLDGARKRAHFLVDAFVLLRKFLYGADRLLELLQLGAKLRLGPFLLGCLLGTRARIFVSAD